jgi:hypothetical protein
VVDSREKIVLKSVKNECACIVFKGMSDLIFSIFQLPDEPKLENFYAPRLTAPA